MSHRGPDGHGTSVYTAGDSTVGLSHQRLAIIDPVGGHQPMSVERYGLHIVFNGEIYNFRELRADLENLGHKFSSNSDTEVLLAAYSEWSDGAISRLNGMFSFALWDARRERLLLARDRFGEKPLFFHVRGPFFAFASEVKALLQLPNVPSAVNQSSLLQYLQYRYVPGPSTLFAGIEKLQAGHYAVWKEGGIHITRYYSPPDTQRRPLQSEVNPTSSFREQFDLSVSSRMVSDVPVGAFLSGGLDSSSIVASMSRLSSHPVKTFSVGFQEGGFSELGYARAVAARFRTDHTEIIVSHKDIVEFLPRLIAFRDAPVAEPSDVAIYVMAREAAKSVKVVLTGEGSDELLGGYPKHLVEYYLGLYHRLPRAVTDFGIPRLAAALPYSSHRLKTALSSMGLRSFNERMPRWFGAMTPQEVSRLARGLDMPSVPSGESNSDSPLRAVLAFDQGSWLADNLLERGDRMTMAASIEARMPFLNHDLVAFISSLPDRARLGKRVLKEAFRTTLPPEILRRRKVGFRLPVHEWFRTDLKEFTEQYLLAGDTRIGDYLDQAQIRRLFVAHLDGRANNEKLLWSLLTLELWHRTYFG